jgi:hypothetical protein
MHDKSAMTCFNPILHTTWLPNHSLILKKNTGKYYFDEKPAFCIPSLKFVMNQGKVKKKSKSFYFQRNKCFKK